MPFLQPRHDSGVGRVVALPTLLKDEAWRRAGSRSSLHYGLYHTYGSGSLAYGKSTSLANSIGRHTSRTLSSAHSSGALSTQSSPQQGGSGHVSPTSSFSGVDGPDYGQHRWGQLLSFSFLAFLQYA